MLFALSLPLLAQQETYYVGVSDLFVKAGTSPADIPNDLSSVFSTFHDVLYKVQRNTDFSKTLIIYPHRSSVTLSGQHYRLEIFTEKLKESNALDLSIVQGLIQAFESAYPPEVRNKPFFGYGALASTAPQLVVLDGFGDDRLITIDLSTFATKFSATLPGGIRNFGLRPAANGPSVEAWVAHSGIGNQISVVNLQTGVIAGQIPTKLDDSSGSLGLVFSTSGNTAFQAVRFTNQALPAPGALVVFDTATRKITNTLPLSFLPQGILLAPDGSTLYVLGAEKIAYYDLLSGTADLTASFPYFSGTPLIHPNGSRIYVLQGDQVAVFDPQSRRSVATFQLGFPQPLNSGLYMQLSQDGLRLYVMSLKGDLVVLDAMTGYSFGSKNFGLGTAYGLFVAPAVK